MDDRRFFRATQHMCKHFKHIPASLIPNPDPNLSIQRAYDLCKQRFEIQMRAAISVVKMRRKCNGPGVWNAMRNAVWMAGTNWFLSVPGAQYGDLTGIISNMKELYMEMCLGQYRLPNATDELKDLLDLVERLTSTTGPLRDVISFKAAHLIADVFRYAAPNPLPTDMCARVAAIIVRLATEVPETAHIWTGINMSTLVRFGVAHIVLPKAVRNRDDAAHILAGVSVGMDRMRNAITPPQYVIEDAYYAHLIMERTPMFEKCLEQDAGFTERFLRRIEAVLTTNFAEAPKQKATTPQPKPRQETVEEYITRTIDECPVCFEPSTDKQMVILDCNPPPTRGEDGNLTGPAHAVCTECWCAIKAAGGLSPKCPVCRHEPCGAMNE